MTHPPRAADAAWAAVRNALPPADPGAEPAVRELVGRLAEAGPGPGATALRREARRLAAAGHPGVAAVLRAVAAALARQTGDRPAHQPDGDVCGSPVEVGVGRSS